jgi:micrococcal nuclease
MVPKKVLLFPLLFLSIGIFLGRISAEGTPLTPIQASVPTEIALPGPRAEASHPEGPAALAIVSRVIDGDTIEIEGGERVRYIGIDTHESVDPRGVVECLGRESAVRNREILEGMRVRLVADVEDRDRYGRLLRYVFLEDGRMVNEVLLEEGYAELLTIPPNVRYVDRFQGALTRAREAKRGLWGAACEEASGPVSPIDTTASTQNGCTIKGNISVAGERIYHLPVCPYYDRTVVSTDRGESFFCSEDDARAAGFRKANNCPE